MNIQVDRHFVIIYLGSILSVSWARAPPKKITCASLWGSGRSFGIIYMGSILYVSWARAKKSICWAPGGKNWKHKKNYMCIYLGLRWSFWYNIHGVHLVCELSNSRSQANRQTDRIVYYCPGPGEKAFRELVKKKRHYSVWTLNPMHCFKFTKVNFLNFRFWVFPPPLSILSYFFIDKLPYLVLWLVYVQSGYI